MKHLIYLSLFMIICAKSYAQLSVSGQVRPRAEFYNGNNSGLSTEDNKPGFAIMQRTRLQLAFSNENVIVHFTPQYINFWGQYAETSTQGAVSIYEAWAGYKFSEKFTLQFGRQPISYGDQRFFGALDWAASGRAHDAFVGKWKTDKVSLDGGVTWNQVGFTNDINTFNNTGAASVKSLQYLWLTAGKEDFSYAGMVANVVTETDPGIYYAYTTIGVMPKVKLSDNFSLSASGYFQFGKFKGTKLGGSLFSIEGTYKAGKMPLTAGADIVSGDKEDTQGKNETWKQQFGTNHKFYGYMDFFYVGEQPSMGLNDFYVKTSFATGKKSKLITHLHYFTANQSFTDEISDTGVSASGYLGTELDLIYNLNISEELNFKLGYSQLFASENFELYKNGSSETINNWAWLQLNLNTSFLKSSK